MATKTGIPPVSARNAFTTWVNTQGIDRKFRETIGGDPSPANITKAVLRVLAEGMDAALRNDIGDWLPFLFTNWLVSLQVIPAKYHMAVQTLGHLGVDVFQKLRQDAVTRNSFAATFEQNLKDAKNTATAPPSKVPYYLLAYWTDDVARALKLLKLMLKADNDHDVLNHTGSHSFVAKLHAALFIDPDVGHELPQVDQARYDSVSNDIGWLIAHKREFQTDAFKDRRQQVQKMWDDFLPFETAVETAIAGHDDIVKSFKGAFTDARDLLDNVTTLEMRRVVLDNLGFAAKLAYQFGELYVSLWGSVIAFMVMAYGRWFNSLLGGNEASTIVEQSSMVIAISLIVSGLFGTWYLQNKYDASVGRMVATGLIWPGAAGLLYWFGLIHIPAGFHLWVEQGINPETVTSSFAMRQYGFQMYFAALAAYLCFLFALVPLDKISYFVRNTAHMLNPTGDGSPIDRILDLLQGNPKQSDAKEALPYDVGSLSHIGMILVDITYGCGAVFPTLALYWMGGTATDWALAGACTLLCGILITAEIWRHTNRTEVTNKETWVKSMRNNLRKTIIETKPYIIAIGIVELLLGLLLTAAWPWELANSIAAIFTDRWVMRWLTFLVTLWFAFVAGLKLFRLVSDDKATRKSQTGAVVFLLAMLVIAGVVNPMAAKTVSAATQVKTTVTAKSTATDKDARKQALCAKLRKEKADGYYTHDLPKSCK